ncbi:MAG TPA: GNAT family N-acetyltransferase, partial [Ilumatobacteraceae bacterium]|nr:GNAT family N-acetyltransferase [Ilumatobacteraceae bacterium]
GDDVPGVFHLGIVDDGQVIAVSTWIPKPAPDGLDAAMPSLHLRGMAAEPAHQGAGLGTILLTSGLAEAKRRGYLSVWGKARDAAINLYVRQGFVVTEPGFVDPITQLPHHLLVRNL